MHTFWKAILAVSAVAATAPAGHAAVVTDLITFTAQFTPGSSGGSATGGPPDATLTGSYTVTFDPTVDVTDATAGLTVNSVVSPDFATIPTGYTVYTNTFGPTSQVLVIGGLVEGAGGTSAFTMDYQVGIQGIDTATPTFYYADIARPTAFIGFADSGTVVVTAVPEPATAAVLPLLPALALRRRRRAGRTATRPAAGTPLATH